MQRAELFPPPLKAKQLRFDLLLRVTCGRAGALALSGPGRAGPGRGSHQLQEGPGPGLISRAADLKMPALVESLRSKLTTALFIKGVHRGDLSTERPLLSQRESRTVV